MLYYDEKDTCGKCGEKLKSYIVEYDYYHDGGAYDDSYKKVDRQSAKKVSLDFYCNSCYDKIAENQVDQILDTALKFLNNDLVEAIANVTEHYEKKMRELDDIKEYVENCISFLKNKNTLSELTKEEMNLLLQRNNIYMAAHQNIKNGFCGFKQYSEVKELYGKME